MAGPLVGESNDPGVAGVQGIHTAGQAAVGGKSDDGRGVLGVSERGQGVWGHSESSTGVVGVSTDGFGTTGHSNRHDGVHGTSQTANGVHGRGPTGGFFEGGSEAGVHAINLGNGAAVHAEARGTGAAIAAVGGTGGNHAGIFRGNVQVTGDITLANADCAEDFDVSGTVEIDPGTVVVLDEEGTVTGSLQAYDKRVAGVVSGAGGLKPGIILDRGESNEGKLPVALMGKVACKVDARQSPIEVGDLLTTSSIPGYAMKADDPFKAFGAVLGKALRPLKEGQGLIPVLVALQ